jgi:DNA invertase Pin-like site-specific DNA recombinase
MDAAVYLRISADRTGEQLGVARQREDCEKLCADKGWQPVEYLDNDVSATSGKKRPQYERMLADIRDGRIGAVVAWDLDRLHRRPIELERFMALADEKHLALATVSGDVDLSTAQGRLIARLKGSVAAHESEHKVARQKRAAQQKAEQGRPQWRHATGYVDGKPDPKYARLLTKVYRLILSGGSLRDGCKILNDAKAYRLWVRRPVDPITGEKDTVIEEREWTEQSLSAFLRKPRNAGLREHNGEIVLTKDDDTGEYVPVKGQWQPLVDEDLWRGVQDVMARNRAGRRTYRRHLLSGLLGCGNCGHHLTAQHTAKRKIQYNCKACHGIGVGGEHVEPWVLSLIGERLSRKNAKDLLRSERHDTAEAEEIRKQVRTLNERLAGLGRDHGNGLLSALQVKEASDVINAQLAAIESNRQDRDKAHKFNGIRLGTPQAAEDVLALSPDRLRAVIDVIVEITVMPADKAAGIRKGQLGRTFEEERMKVVWQ